MSVGAAQIIPYRISIRRGDNILLKQTLELCVNSKLPEQLFCMVLKRLLQVIISRGVGSAMA